MAFQGRLRNFFFLQAKAFYSRGRNPQNPRLMCRSILFLFALLLAVTPVLAKETPDRTEAPAFLKLKENATPPAPCDAAHDGAVALRKGGGLCVCSRPPTTPSEYWAEYTSKQPCWPKEK
jgi:hypothetical protein